MVAKIFTLLSTALLLACSVDSSSGNIQEKENSMMLMRDKEAYVIASPLTGRLTQEGKPLANATIVRKLTWNSNTEGVFEEFATDENGYFSLPMHEQQLELGKLTQFACGTQLDVLIDGEAVNFWYNSKFDAEMHSETGGEISGLVCELTEDRNVVRTGLSKVMTICRWANMPEAD